MFSVKVLPAWTAHSQFPISPISLSLFTISQLAHFRVAWFRNFIGFSPRVPCCLFLYCVVGKLQEEEDEMGFKFKRITFIASPKFTAPPDPTL